jgi:PhnB protein
MRRPDGSYSGAMANPPDGYPRVSPYLLYEDAAAAVRYLVEAFGFEVRRSELGGAGRAHYELLLGDDGLVMLGQAADRFSSPRTLGLFPPSMTHVYVDDVEALHRRATDAGADVTDLELSEAGDRRFTATDLETKSGSSHSASPRTEVSRQGTFPNAGPGEEHVMRG